VTNQGWLSETDRAALLSEQLSMAITKEQVVLAHSALAEAAPAINPGLVLVTGRCRTDAAEIVRGYGFDNVRTVAEYARAHPHLHPLKHDAGTGGGGGGGGDGGEGKDGGGGDGEGKDGGGGDGEGEDGGGGDGGEGGGGGGGGGGTPAWASEPVRAVYVSFLRFLTFREEGGGGTSKQTGGETSPLSSLSPLAKKKKRFVVETPQDWHEDLQILLDVLRSDGTPGSQGESSSKTRQPVAFFCCNFDFYFAAANAPPRFGPGAFLAALEALHAAADAAAGASPHVPLEIVRHGKPHPPAYEVAARKLERLAASSPARPLRHIYALGDNPASDVRGANAAGGPWRSVLVRTGVWKGGGGGGGGGGGPRRENDERDPAHFVCEDAAEAVEMILGRSGC